MLLKILLVAAMAGVAAVGWGLILLPLLGAPLRIEGIEIIPSAKAVVICVVITVLPVYVFWRTLRRHHG